VLKAALHALEREGIEVIATAPVLLTDPIGPSIRRYVNGAAVVETTREPPDLLLTLKHIERQFGRRARGQRWSARVLDLDVILWSGGPFAAPGLVIPHRLFRARDFVLAPAAAIAGDWRDPITHLTVHQLHARLTRPRPVRR
jgi:2-amino-4-hydroxy-6-hydroxymethyldihydropteridine diphosphokinase